MNRRCGLLAGVLALCCPGQRAEAAEDRPSAAPHWYGDYEQARTAARTAGKPLFIVFRCEH